MRVGRGWQALVERPADIFGALRQRAVQHAQYEKGVHIPKFPRLKDLATALNVPTAYFYADDDELAELLYNYGRITRAQKREMLKAINR